VCDIVHTLLMERVERETLAVRMGLIARGAGGELPSMEKAQADYDVALAAPPESRSTNSVMHERLKAAS